MGEAVSARSERVALRTGQATASEGATARVLVREVAGQWAGTGTAGARGIGGRIARERRGARNPKGKARCAGGASRPLPSCGGGGQGRGGGGRRAWVRSARSPRREDGVYSTGQGSCRLGKGRRRIGRHREVKGTGNRSPFCQSIRSGFQSRGYRGGVLNSSLYNSAHGQKCTPFSDVTILTTCTPVHVEPCRCTVDAHRCAVDEPLLVRAVSSAYL